MKADRPSDEGYAAAAWFLSCEPRALKAIAIVEAGPEGAFLPDERPVILFERHVFRRLTDGRFDEDAPDLSSKFSGGYGPGGVWQHQRLARAAQLDREAALMSCSWGLFQCMGFNHAEAGFPSLQGFVNAMYRSAEDHLRALVMFLRSDDRMAHAIREKDWTEFSRVYNGPKYAESQYDRRIAKAYASLAELVGSLA